MAVKFFQKLRSQKIWAVFTGLLCIAVLFCVLILPKFTQAQSAPLCVPYIPAISYETRTGVIPDNAFECVNDSFSVSYGTWITDTPVVALAGFEFRFTDDDQSYGYGEVNVTNVIPGLPNINSVTIQTRICFRDRNNDNPRWYSYTLAVGSWLNQ